MTVTSDNTERPPTAHNFIETQNPMKNSADPYFEKESNTHLQTLEAFSNDLQDATKIILAKKRRYDRVVAFVTYWANSDREYIKRQGGKLWDLFRDKYKFEVGKEPYEIPEQRPQIHLTNKLCSEVAKIGDGSQNNLFILYYGGHAVIKKHKGRAYWKASESNDASPEIDWTSVQPNLEDEDCDFLFLFDCCYAGDLIDNNIQWKGRCELFGASGAMAKARGQENSSFTAALTAELERDGCDIRLLHRVLCDSEKRKDYNLKTDPWYVEYSRPHQPSISLISLKISCEKPIDDDADTMGDSKTIYQQLAASSDARVLFKVTFADPRERPILDEWKQFFRFHPSHVFRIDVAAHRETKLYGLFTSNSSIAVMSMPMWLWDSLPPRQVYDYLGVVRSGNLLDMNDSEKEIQTGDHPLALLPVGDSPSPSLPPALIRKRLEQNTSQKPLTPKTLLKHLGDTKHEIKSLSPEYPRNAIFPPRGSRDEHLARKIMKAGPPLEDLPSILTSTNWFSMIL